MPNRLRALLCVEERVAHEYASLQTTDGPVTWVGHVSSGGEAVARQRLDPADVVVIAGDLDGCGGARVAAVLAREGTKTIVIVAPAAAQSDVEAEVETRGAADVVRVVPAPRVGAEGEASARLLRSQFLLSAVSGVVAPSWRSAGPLQVRPEIAALASSTIDTTLLIGSAGTPHLLPELLPRRPSAAARLVVAVHHNPMWSDGFIGWVRDLVGGGPIEVVPARAQGKVVRLSPDLGTVVRSVAADSASPLVCVASGMTEEGLGALSTLRRDGGTVVALDPSSCPQPAMVDMAIGAGWTDAVVSIDELAWLISHAGEERLGLPIAV